MEITMPKLSNKAAVSKAKKTQKPIAASRSVTKTIRADTKSSLILKLLGRANGATVKEIATATSWQDHSVRGFLSGTLKKKLGLIVESEIIDGARHYRIDHNGVGQ
jgi:hypothetical protein